MLPTKPALFAGLAAPAEGAVGAAESGAARSGVAAPAEATGATGATGDAREAAAVGSATEDALPVGAGSRDAAARSCLQLAAVLALTMARAAMNVSTVREGLRIPSV